MRASRPPARMMKMGLTVAAAVRPERRYMQPSLPLDCAAGPPPRPGAMTPGPPVAQPGRSGGATPISPGVSRVEVAGGGAAAKVVIPTMPSADTDAASDSDFELAPSPKLEAGGTDDPTGSAPATGRRPARVVSIRGVDVEFLERRRESFDAGEEVESQGAEATPGLSQQRAGREEPALHGHRSDRNEQEETRAGRPGAQTEQPDRATCGSPPSEGGEEEACVARASTWAGPPEGAPFGAPPNDGGEEEPCLARSSTWAGPPGRAPPDRPSREQAFVARLDTRECSGEAPPGVGGPYAAEPPGSLAGAPARALRCRNRLVAGVQPSA